MVLYWTPNQEESGQRRIMLLEEKMTMSWRLCSKPSTVLGGLGDWILTWLLSEAWRNCPAITTIISWCWSNFNMETRSLTPTPTKSPSHNWWKKVMARHIGVQHTLFVSRYKIFQVLYNVLYWWKWDISLRGTINEHVCITCIVFICVHIIYCLLSIILQEVSIRSM